MERPYAPSKCLAESEMAGAEVERNSDECASLADDVEVQKGVDVDQ